MSPVFLFLDLLLLVIGLPLAWTLRDLAPHGLRGAGGLPQLARGGAIFTDVASSSMEGRPRRDLRDYWPALEDTGSRSPDAGGIFFNC
jgi:hypothetical protein